MVLASIYSHAERTTEQLFTFIDAQGHTDYIGEAVSQLQHSLQCAALAEAANADDETVVAALMHDIGRYIPAADKMPKFIAPDGKYIGRGSHDILGERYLKQLGFSEKVCQLVGAHVSAKKYLCAKEEGYWESLSKSSKRSLEFQGGKYNKEQVKEVEKDPWLQEKLQVRRWDDFAKDPNVTTPPLEAYRDRALKCLLESRSTFSFNSRQYMVPKQSTVVIYVDGLDKKCLESSFNSGHLPEIAKFIDSGFYATAEPAKPSTAQSNNLAIISGILSPQQINNDEKSNGSEYPDATLLSLLSNRGVRVAAITAEENVHKAIGAGLEGTCFCAENTCNEIQETIGGPSKRNSTDSSLSALEAGLNIMQERRADVLYLNLSSCKEVWQTEDLKKDLDAKIGQFAKLGAVVAVTGSSVSQEQQVPIILSRPLRDEYVGGMRNWEICDIIDLATKCQT